MDASPARTSAERYVDAINRRDSDALMGLFAPDATLHHPTGTYRGHHEIREFYERLVFLAEVTVEIRRLIAADTIAMAELSGSSPFATVPTQVLDVFEVDSNGKIVNLAIYVR